jgi:hypothetical protein
VSSDSQRAEGHDIYQAGRDLIVSFTDRKRLREFFGELLTGVDRQINDLVPAGFQAPNTRPQRFSSEHLVVSLAKSGIPIPVALDVLEALERHLVPLLAQVGTPTTGHLRRAVLEAIYALSDPYGHSNVEHWADVYARRWGNPYERVVVLERDGTSTTLDFTFLLERLLPHLIRNVVQVPYEQLREAEIISKSAARHMADEILDHVKSMNLYGIRYKTLYNLAYDLAVQPPHPWFVTSDTRLQTVTYDLQRAKHHDAALDQLLAHPDKGPCRHALREAIHHACSAILASYRAFLGASLLGSLAQLIDALALSVESGHPLIWEVSAIRQIEGDLRALGHSKDDFLENLVRLQHNQSVSDAKLEVVVRQTHRLVALSSQLCTPSPELSPILEDSIEGPLPRTQLIAAIEHTIRRIDGMDYLRPHADYGLWFAHRLQSPLFRVIHPEVLFVALPPPQDAPDEVTALTPFVESALRDVAGAPLCNCAVLVAPARCTSQGRQLVYSHSTKDSFVFLMDTSDLASIVTAKDRAGQLAKLLYQH